MKKRSGKIVFRDLSELFVSAKRSNQYFIHDFLFSEHYGSCDDLSFVSDDLSELSTNMELNEERLVQDFPNHNWLFNKYNLYEVDVNTEKEKDNIRKHKRKQKQVNKWISR